VLPKPDKTYPHWQKALFAKLPGALWLSRASHYLAHEVRAFAFISWPAALRVKRRAFFRHLKDGGTDDNKRRRLVPHYRIGCKRILISNDYFQRSIAPTSRS